MRVRPRGPFYLSRSTASAIYRSSPILSSLKLIEERIIESYLPCCNADNGSRRLMITPVVILPAPERLVDADNYNSPVCPRRIGSQAFYPCCSPSLSFQNARHCACFMCFCIASVRLSFRSRADIEITDAEQSPSGRALDWRRSGSKQSKNQLRYCSMLVFRCLRAICLDYRRPCLCEPRCR